MGITQNSIDRLRRHDLLKPAKMLELGAQNMYDEAHYGSIAKDFFSALGIAHTSWDINPHQGAVKMDLREELPYKIKYDVITDFGTTEHVSGNYYQAHRNIHNICKVGGYIVHETPKTGHWPGHGCNYVTKEFYTKLAAMCKYEIIELEEHFAMGNTTDGCLICVVLKKTKGGEFISKEDFLTLPCFPS